MALGRYKRYKIAPIQQVWLHGHVSLQRSLLLRVSTADSLYKLRLIGSKPVGEDLRVGDGLE